MQGAWLVLKRTAGKFFDDNGLFLASGLAFDLLLFCFPFSLLFVSALGFALGDSDRAIEALRAILQELLPITRPAFMENLVMVLENKGLLGLLGGGNLPLEQLHSWLPAWQTAYQGQPVNPGLEHLHPHRLNYYLRALENMLVSGAAFQMALWPLATTWTALALHSAPASAVWQEFAAALGLVGDGLAGRLAALDAYLDTVDETLETWGREKGA